MAQECARHLSVCQRPSEASFFFFARHLSVCQRPSRDVKDRIWESPSGRQEAIVFIGFGLDGFTSRSNTGAATHHDASHRAPHSSRCGPHLWRSSGAETLALVRAGYSYRTKCTKCSTTPLVLSGPDGRPCLSREMLALVRAGCSYRTKCTKKRLALVPWLSEVISEPTCGYLPGTCVCTRLPLSSWSAGTPAMLIIMLSAVTTAGRPQCSL